MLHNKSNIYTIELVEEYLKTNPNPKNKDLYSFCNATTTSQKQCVRRKKLQLQKIPPPPEGYKFSSDKLLGDDLEKRLVEALDRHPDNPTLLRTAIEFYIKVKGKESEMEEQIDITELLTNGIVKKFNS